MTQCKIYLFIYFITVDLPAAYLFIFLLAVVPVLIYLFLPGGLADPYFFSFSLIFLVPGEVTYLFIFLVGFAQLIFHFSHSFLEFFRNKIFK